MFAASGRSSSATWVVHARCGHTSWGFLSQRGRLRRLGVRSQFDVRVVPAEVANLVRACQDRFPCRLGGGAALSGAYLGHRLSRDVDLVCRRAEDVRALVRDLPEIERLSGSKLELVRDAGTFIRAK